MPLAPNQKEFVLRRASYDPIMYDVDDNGVVTPIKPKTVVQPAAMANGTPQPILPAPTPAGPLKTAGEFALREAPVGVGAGFGARAGMGIAGGIANLAKVAPNPYIKGAGAIVGALGGGALTSAGLTGAEEFAAERSDLVSRMKAQMDADRAANPISATVGGITGAGLAGGMNPSLPNVVRGLGTGAQIGGNILARGAPLSGVAGADAANLVNVGIGGALGAGIPVGQQLMQGKGIGEALTSPETLLNAAGGMVFNRPNRIGQKLFGFTPDAEPGRLTDRNQSNLEQEGSVQKVKVAEERLAFINQELARLTSAKRTNPPDYEQANPYAVRPSPSTMPLELLRSVTQTQEPIMAENPASGKAADAGLATVKQPTMMGEKSTLSAEPILKTNVKTPVSPTLATAEQAASATFPLENQKFANDLYSLLQNPEITDPKALMEAYQAKLKRESKLEQTPEANEPYTLDATEGLVEQTPEAKRAAEMLGAAGRDVKLSRGTSAEIAKHAKTKGIDTTENPNLPVLGRTHLKEGLQRMAVEINPDTATLDTPFHEGGGHAYFQFLRDSPYQADKNLVKRYEKLVTDSGVVDRLNAKRVENGQKPYDVEEYMASQQGFEAILRDPTLNGETPFKRWMGDWKAHMKTLLNKGSEADIRRVIDRKWHSDAPFEKYFKGKAGVEGAVVSAGARAVDATRNAEEGLNEARTPETLGRKSWPKETYDKALQLKRELAQDLVYHTNKRGGNLDRLAALHMLDDFIWQPEKLQRLKNSFTDRDGDLFFAKFEQYKNITDTEKAIGKISYLTRHNSANSRNAEEGLIPTEEKDFSSEAFYKSTDVDADSTKAVPLLEAANAKATSDKRVALAAIRAAEQELTLHNKEIESKPDDYFVTRPDEHKTHLDFLRQNERNMLKARSDLRQAEHTLISSEEYLNFHKKSLEQKETRAKENTKPVVPDVEDWQKAKIPDNVKDPTPGTMQSITKYGQAEDSIRQVQAVAEGKKPVATFANRAELDASIPSNVHTSDELPHAANTVDVLRIRAPKAVKLLGEFAVVRKGYLDDFNALMRAVHANDTDAIGKALGYTDLEVQEFKTRSEQVDIQHQERRVRDAEEGLQEDKRFKAVKQTHEERLAQQKRERDQRRAELETVRKAEQERLGVTPRQTGQRQFTLDQDRVPLDQVIDYENPFRNDSSKLETFDALDTAIMRSVRAAMRNIATRTGYMIPFNKADFQNIRSEVRAVLMEKGIDTHGTLQQTLTRRAHDAIDREMTDFEKRGGKRTVSLDREFDAGDGKESKTLHDIVAKEADVDEIAAEMDLADEINDVTDTTPPEEQTGPDIAPKDRPATAEELASLVIPTKAAKPTRKPRVVAVSKKAASNIEKTVGFYRDHFGSELEGLKHERAILVETEGVQGENVEKIDNAIERVQLVMDTLGKLPDTTKINLADVSKGKITTRDAEEGLTENRTIYDRAGKLGAIAQHIIAPEVEKLRALSPKAGAAAEDFYQKQRSYRGKFEQTLIRNIKAARDARTIKEWVMQDNPDNQAVLKWRDIKQDGEEPGFTLTPDQQKINEAIDKNLKLTFDERESRTDLNDMPGLARGTKQKPYYLPHTMARKVSNALAENPSSAESIGYLNEFIKYRTAEARGANKQTAEEARADWQTLRGNFNMQEKANTAARFGAVDKAAGRGLPRGMREQNLQDRMARFNRRFARRLAYYDSIQANKEGRDALFNPETGVASTTPGKNVVEDIFGIRDHEESLRNAIAGVVRAAMLGPLTGAKDVVSGQVLGLQHMDMSQVLPAKMSALKNYRESYRKAIDNGIIRDNVGSLESGDEGLKKVQEVMGRTRDIMNKIQGRNSLENASRTLNYGEGQYLAMDALTALKRGQLTGQRREFLEKFLPDWKSYENGEVPSAKIDEAAARFVESVQGTYDYRGLPSIAMKGSLALPLSLARWNIEKFNNFTKHVVEPAVKGDYKPLLMSTIGMFIGGAAVEKLVEEVTNRKSRVPTWKEIENSKEQTELTAYKLASLASMAGYAGILGDVVMSTMNARMGNRPQTWNNPLLTGLSTAIEDTGFIVEVLAEGDIPKIADVLNMVMSDYIQAYRVGIAHFSPEKQEQLDRANKNRDLKVFELGEGLPASQAQTKRPNPLMNTEMREFKQTDDIQRAIELVQPLIQKAIEDAKGNPEQIRANLTKLKANSYQTMPSPSRSPYTFSRYNEFLTKTQGPEAAQERIQDYVIQNAKNRAKASMIP